MAYQFSNLDPSYVTETLTRQVMGIVMGSNKGLINDAMKLMTINPSNLAGSNFWELGLSVGRLIKALTDFNVDN